MGTMGARGAPVANRVAVMMAITRAQAVAHGRQAATRPTAAGAAKPRAADVARPAPDASGMTCRLVSRAGLESPNAASRDGTRHGGCARYGSAFDAARIR
jgi:hypothetical protein